MTPFAHMVRQILPSRAMRAVKERLSTPRRVLREAQLCRSGEMLTAPMVAVIFGVSRSTAKRDIRALREYGFLQ